MEKSRLLWASRRGMLELDLILMPFVEHVYPTLDESDRQRYWKLLDQEDQDLFAWLLGRRQPHDPDLLRIVQLVCDSARRSSRAGDDSAVSVGRGGSNDV